MATTTTTTTTTKEVRFATDSEELARDRTDYYDKWHKFAKDEVTKTEKTEAEEKEEANKALGIDPNAPKSETEKQEREKLAALKEAKKQWDQKKLSEASQKHTIENLSNVNKVFDSVKLHWKPVLSFKSLKHCDITLPSDLKHKLIKVFVDDCEDCSFHFSCPLITQHIEIAHSQNLTVYIKHHLATLQIDLSKTIKVVYSSGLFIEKKVKIYHAGVENLTVSTEDGHHHETCYLKNLSDSDEKLPKEVQFITQLLNNKLETKRVIRDKGNLPSTKEEIEQKELTPKDYFRDAELKKIGGNEAFEEKNFAQAAIFYTEAIDTLNLKTNFTAESDLEKLNNMLSVLFANRAFCWQKLGHHDKAEADAKECLKLKPEYVKGIFRLGLALHAQKKYFEAAPVLGKALKLEPKNEQIKQALGFL